jgi:hypothetical protein
LNLARLAPIKHARRDFAAASLSFEQSSRLSGEEHRVISFPDLNGPIVFLASI